ncbi:MAG: sulfurtransferase complex subunit TusB [Pseudomonadota bacterium]
MSILHIVNKSPFEHTSMNACLRLAKKGASIIFIEDGTYALRPGSTVADKIATAMQDYRVYALEPDMVARGLSKDAALQGVFWVDYAGFVQLTTEHDKVNSWL